MNLLGFFRRQPPIREPKELADFIDEQSAYIMQKGIYDYAQARAGHYTKVLFKESEFLEAVERSRWQAYPLGLAMVGEMVDGVLRAHAADDKSAILDALIAIVLSVFDRYPVPPSLGQEQWADLRSELGRKLGLVGLRPPRRVIDIPEAYARRYFNLMPFNKDVLTRDMPTTRSYLQLTLTNIRDELIKRMDALKMVRALRSEFISG